MTSLRKILAPLVAIALSGCFSVPAAQQAMRVDSPVNRSTESPFCDAAQVPSASDANRGTGLDPEKLRVLTWNVHKGDRAGWLTDLAWFGAEHDLVLIQEARLADPLRRVLRDEDLHWALAGAFRYRELDTGVLTAARARVDLACMLRAVEPLTRIPKTVVVTRHPFAGSSASLLVANVHAVNFTLGTSRLRGQLEAVAAILARHEGPVILAGDFNTWSTARRRAVDAIALRLGLRAIPLEPDERSRFLGEPVDQMYYRGLVPGAATAVPVRSSDHNPVSAVFRLADREE
ncbi:MAG: endonuclease/exonuclease/phosphatase family protein [Candidatus Binatia bacterium]